MPRLATASLAVLLAACSWGALDGFSGGPGDESAGSDSGTPADSGGGGTIDADAGKTLVRGTSCAAIKASNAAAPDGRYVIEVAGKEPFEADCDMTREGGGWMRVTEAMLVEEKKLATTVVHELDENGGLVIRVYANSVGCGNGKDDDSYLAVIRDMPRWTDLRARYDFYGHSACWNILGTKDTEDPFVANMTPFDPAIDIARDAVKMGGSAGDAWNGDPSRCDNDTDNFWAVDKSAGRRSIVATLRRASPDIAAGIATTTSCTEVGAGASSPTYWEYREIYVR